MPAPAQPSQLIPDTTSNNSIALSLLVVTNCMTQGRFPLLDYLFYA